MKTIPIQPVSDLPTTCSSSELLALRVLDDSMAPEFNVGHVVVIDGSARLAPGAFVLVRKHKKNLQKQPDELTDDWIIRRWSPIDSSQVVLETLNSQWEDKQVAVCDVDVQGVVVQRAGRRRSERRHYR